MLVYLSDMNGRLELNTNQYVYVLLTEFGISILKEFNLQLPSNAEYIIDDKGGMYLELHQIMYIFGKHCYAGNDPVFKDNSISIGFNLTLRR